MPAERPSKTALLRLRFASVDQLRAHLHVEDNTTVLFFRDPALEVTAGVPALLEIVFDSSEEMRVVRTTALARAEGMGLWLMMPHARFAREVHERGLVPRKGRRLGTDRFVRMRREAGTDHLVQLQDLSLAGARISGGLPVSLAVSEDVTLTLASTEPGEAAEIGRARVAWVEAGEAGVLFDRASPACRAAVMKLFQSIEARWRSAREVRHPDACCRGGALMEPPVPRFTTGKKQSAGG